MARLTEEYLNDCESIAREFDRLYKGFNLCGVMENAVQLTTSAFLETFETYEKKEHSSEHDQVRCTRNGIEFYALVPITQEETQ